jgi:Flp pilus assembly protein TadD
MLQGEGRLQDALWQLRAACRNTPNVPVYLNDLGVTEMRLGILHRARHRFLTALEVDPGYQVGLRRQGIESRGRARGA